MNTALERLCLDADVGGSSYTRRMWLGTSLLKGHLVLAPDEETAQFIRRCLLERFRTVITDCEVFVKGTEPVKGKLIWNKGDGRAAVQLKLF